MVRFNLPYHAGRQLSCFTYRYKKSDFIVRLLLALGSFLGLTAFFLNLGGIKWVVISAALDLCNPYSVLIISALGVATIISIYVLKKYYQNKVGSMIVDVDSLKSALEDEKRRRALLTQKLLQESSFNEILT